MILVQLEKGAFPSLPPACPPAFFTVFADFSVSGVFPLTAITTLGQCLSQCVSNNDCAALNWDATASTHCWLHLNSVGDRMSRVGVVHYVVADRCPRGEFRYRGSWIVHYEKRHKLSLLCMFEN